MEGQGEQKCGLTQERQTLQTLGKSSMPALVCSAELCTECAYIGLLVLATEKSGDSEQPEANLSCLLQR